MAVNDDRVRVPAELVTGALVAAATLPLTRLFSGGGIGGTIVGTLIVSAGLAWGLRRLRVPAIPAALASAVAFAWFASAAWARGEMWGPFPSASSLEELGRALSEGTRAAQEEVAPVFASIGLKVLISALVWGLAWLADDAVAKLRHPLLAIAFCLPILVFPGTLLPDDRWWVDAGLFLAASLAVLFTDERIRLARWGRLTGLGRLGWRPGLAARMGTLVIVAAIAISPLVPTQAASDAGVGGTGPVSGAGIALNPLVSILPRLNTTPVVQLFTVTSPVPTYWRLTSLDFFDGNLWTARVRGPARAISDRTVAADTPSSGARRVVQRYRFNRLAGAWLPAAYDPVRVEDRPGVRIDDPSRTLTLSGRVGRNQEATVISMVNTLDAAALDSVTSIDDRRLTPYLLLPALPERVRRLAEDITRDEPTPFRKAVALQENFKTYIYDENVAAGHSINSLVDFLFREQRGYCEQFAGAMAVLARQVGLPSRVVIGFAVGEQTARNTYRVTTRHAHAWVEIFFPGQGWVTFEPTPRPDGGVAQPAYTRPEALAPGPDTSPTSGPNASPTAAPDSELDPRLLEEGDVPDFTPPPEAAPRGSWVWLLAPGGVVASLMLLPGAAWVRRRRRYRGATGPLEEVRLAYVEFLEWCATVHLPRWPGETPAEYARRLAEVSTTAGGPALGLAELATEALYAAAARPEPDRARRLGAEARRAISATLPRHIRILPAIGWGWWRGDGLDAGLRPV